MYAHIHAYHMFTHILCFFFLSLEEKPQLVSPLEVSKDCFNVNKTHAIPQEIFLQYTKHRLYM